MNYHKYKYLVLPKGSLKDARCSSQDILTEGKLYKILDFDSDGYYSYAEIQHDDGSKRFIIISGKSSHFTGLPILLESLND